MRLPPSHESRTTPTARRNPAGREPHIVARALAPSAVSSRGRALLLTAATAPDAASIPAEQTGTVEKLPEAAR